MGDDNLHNRLDKPIEPIERLRRLSRQIDMVRQRIAENLRQTWKEDPVDASAHDTRSPRARRARR